MNARRGLNSHSSSLQSDKFHIPFLSESHPFEYVNQEPPTVAYSILGASSE
jgi:hypothetical protein